MGMIIEFFVANNNELKSTFAGWCIVSKKKGKQTYTDPFTGEASTVITWKPAGLIKEGDDHAFKNVTNLPHYSSGRIDPVKLATLQELLCGTDYDEAFEEIVTPALIHADTPDECGLHRLPDILIKDLAELDKTSVASISKQWSKTDEMVVDRADTKSTTQLLLQLSTLASKSVKTGSPMYYLWSL